MTDKLGLKNGNGIIYMRRRICGDYCQMISGRHFSKHEISHDRYTEQYKLSADAISHQSQRLKKLWFVRSQIYHQDLVVGEKGLL